jgi:RHS repeat-associated protein
VTNAPSPIGGVIYDLNGNTRTNHGGQWLYFYDAENRLSQFYRYDTVNPKETQFVYDGLGRLRKRLEWHFEQDSGSGPQGTAPSGSVQTDGSGTGSWVLDSETHYIYDGFRVIQERDANDVPTVSYTRGNDLSMSLGGAGGIGGLLARSDGYSGGDWTDHAYYYADAGGNITSMLDTNNIVVASYRYDPYGNLISSSGTLAAANVYRFSSKEFHANSGLYYYGFRFYDPNLQRWVNQDPIGEAGGINLYAFAGNSAQNYLDPIGLSWYGDLFNSVGDAELAAADAVRNFFLGPPDGGQLSDPDTLRAGSGLIQGLKDENGNDITKDTLADVALAPLLAAIGGPESEGATIFGDAIKCKKLSNVAKAAGVKNLVGAAEELPQLEVSASKYPDLAQNIYHAQQAGHPQVLTAGGDIAANRAAALDGVPKIPGLSRDEYPFASSKEGGEGAWVGHIPPSQQNSQGGLIKNFNNANNITPGMQYKVAIVP